MSEKDVRDDENNEMNSNKIDTKKKVDNKENKDERKQAELNVSFLKRLKISVINFEQYFIIAAEKPARSILYLLKIFLIFALIVASINLFKFYNEINEKGEDSQVINYLYEQLENQGIQINITKKELIENLTGDEKYNLLSYIFIYLFITVFTIYFITTLINVLALSVLGLLVTRIVRLPIKYSAVFSMAASAISLSVILNLIYIIVNVLTGFTMEYFQIMYTLISYIYMISAILIMRSNLIRINPINQKKKDEYNEDDKEENEAN